MMQIIKKIFSLVLLLQSVLVISQIPSGYYDETENLTGQELKVKLHKIIRNHRVRSYAEFRDTILPDLDEDPTNSNNIILFYKNNSIPKSNFANGNDDWNREHTWPKSHGFPEESDTTYTDAHNLRPSDASVNTSKSNKDFDNVEHITENEEGDAPDTYTNSDFWEPRDEIKGDVARILFYMSTRYESDRLDLEIVDRKSFSGDPEIGVLLTLLMWHEQDPVDQSEMDRHEGVFGYQENRNPFIDHPEWVEEIWGLSTDPILISDRLNFSDDFGFVELGSSLTQQYNLTAYNLTDDVSVKTTQPFSVSSDGVNFMDSIGYSNDNSGEQELTIYVKFEPSVTDQNVTADVINYTDGDTVKFQVQGKEGAQSLISISDARKESLGSVVAVTGVVIDAGNNSGNSRVIYDGTAGIVVRSFDAGNESANLIQGDSITVSGGLGEFNNLLQISESPIVINVIKQNSSLPSPKIVDIGEVGEDYESQLIVIENVYFVESGVFAGGGSGGNFTVTNGTDDLIFRIGSSDHPLVGEVIPEGIYNVTGIVGQFGDDYQLSPRTANDLVFVSDGGSGEIDLSTIAEARLKNLGDKVKVTGVVIDNGNNSSTNRIIFDGTAGIVVRSFDSGNESSDLIQGDSVVISGGLSEFNNLLQIEESPIQISVIKQGASLPSPQVISIDQVEESYESELVEIKGVSFKESGNFEGGGSGGNLTITDGTNDLIFRIGSSDHPLVGTEIEKGIYDVVGFVGQFGDSYQLSPRDESDLVLIASALGLQPVELRSLVYPNPVKESFRIQIPSSEFDRATVTILNLEGKVLKKLVNKGEPIKVNSISNGIYILVVEIADVSYHVRLLVEK